MIPPYKNIIHLSMDKFKSFACKLIHFIDEEEA